LNLLGYLNVIVVFLHLVIGCVSRDLDSYFEVDTLPVAGLLSIEKQEIGQVQEQNRFSFLCTKTF